MKVFATTLCRVVEVVDMVQGLEWVNMSLPLASGSGIRSRNRCSRGLWF